MPYHLAKIIQLSIILNVWPLAFYSTSAFAQSMATTNTQQGSLRLQIAGSAKGCVFNCCQVAAKQKMIISSRCSDLKKKRQLIVQTLKQLQDIVATRKNTMERSKNALKNAKINLANKKKDYDDNCYWIYFYKKTCKDRAKQITNQQSIIATRVEKNKKYAKKLATGEKVLHKRKLKIQQIESSLRRCGKQDPNA